MKKNEFLNYIENLKSIETSKKSKKNPEELKKNKFNYHYSEKNSWIRLYHDFGTSIEEIETKSNYKLDIKIDKKNSKIYLIKGNKGITIKNTEKKSTSDNYLQFPKSIFDEITHEDKKIKIEEPSKGIFEIDLNEITK